MIIRKRWQIVVLCLGGLVLALHFSALLVYANPLSSGKSKASFLAGAYVYPWFHQNWNLFAPAPDCNYQLIAVYKHHGLQRVDLFSEIVSRHQANRLAGYEPLVIAFSNSIHYFEKNSPLQQSLNGPMRNDRNFVMLEQAARSYLRYSRGHAPDSLRLMLVVDDIHSGQRRAYFN